MSTPVQPSALTVTDRFGELVDSAGLRWVDGVHAGGLEQLPPGTLAMLRDSLSTAHRFRHDELVLTLDCVLLVRGGRRGARQAAHDLAGVIREDRSLGGHVIDTTVSTSATSATTDDPSMGVADMLIEIRYHGLGA